MGQISRRARLFFGRLRRYAGGSHEPPRTKWHRLAYGAAQPVFALRTLARSPDLWAEALIPAVLLGAFCALVGLAALAAGRGGFWHTAYRSFALLAPVPSILFARHYARLAARVRVLFGFSAKEPRLEPLRESVRRSLAQAACVYLPSALLFVPGIVVTVVIALVNRDGAKSLEVMDLLDAGGVLLFPWALHWIMVDALESARTAGEREQPGTGRTPWFVTRLEAVSASRPNWPRLVHGAMGRIARLVDRLSRDVRPEITLVEDHAWVALGFSISTLLLLGCPILNLLARPIVVIASTHLRAHLEQAETDTQELETMAQEIHRQIKRGAAAAREHRGFRRLGRG